jgi:hypothetical protein
MSPEELCEWVCELERLPYTICIYKSCTANDNPDMLTALRRHMGDPDVAQLHHDLEDIKIPGWGNWGNDGNVTDQLLHPRVELHDSCLHEVRSQLAEIRFEQAIAEGNKLSAIVRWEGDFAAVANDGALLGSQRPGRE